MNTADFLVVFVVQRRCLWIQIAPFLPGDAAPDRCGFATWSCPLSEPLEHAVCGGVLELGHVCATLRSVIVAVAERAVSEPQRQEQHAPLAGPALRDLRRRLRARDAAFSSDASFTSFTVVVEAVDERFAGAREFSSHRRRIAAPLHLSFDATMPHRALDGALDRTLFPRIAPAELQRVADGAVDVPSETAARHDAAESLSFVGVLNELARRQLLDACSGAAGGDGEELKHRCALTQSIYTCRPAGSPPRVLVTVEKTPQLPRRTTFRFADEATSQQMRSGCFSARYTEAFLARHLLKDSHSFVLPTQTD